MNDPDLAPLIDPTIPGELTITPELQRSFITSLASLNITLRLFSGSWRTLHPQITLASNMRTYDVLLTSETIYHLDSLPSLIDLMRTACTGFSIPEPESETPVTTGLEIDHSSPSEHKIDDGQQDYLCLVAGKVLYFGVGGGVADFLEAVHKVKGRAETVSEWKTGVGRKVIRVRWY
jgi:protein-histidine N-methyltransferase